MIDAPTVIQRLVPDLAEIPDRFDPRVFDNELIRTQIHMSAVWLTCGGSWISAPSWNSF